MLGFGITMLPVLAAGRGTGRRARGLLVAPLATRLRGLYLAIVTLGLVFLGEHIFKEWTSLTGGPGVGRTRPGTRAVRLRRSTTTASCFTREQKLYLLMLVLLVVFARRRPATWRARQSDGRSPPSATGTSPLR